MERATGAPAVLDDAAKRTAARIAVAEVQRHLRCLPSSGLRIL
jgi:hypothetical protein